MKILSTKNGCKIIKLLGGRSNVFLLQQKNKNLLIDTSPKRKWKKLYGRLKSLNIDCIDFLVLTHTHFDHSANAARIKANFNAKIIVQQLEKQYLSAGKNVFPKGTNLFTNILMTLANRFLINSFNFEPVEPDYTVNSNLDLKPLGFDAYIIHTPGHSAGSLSIIINNEIAVVGDTIFGVFRCTVLPPFIENLSDLLKSWRVLLDTNCNVFLPSHGRMKLRMQLQKNLDKLLNYNKLN